MGSWGTESWWFPAKTGRVQRQWGHGCASGGLVGKARASRDFRQIRVVKENRTLVRAEKPVVTDHQNLLRGEHRSAILRGVPAIPALGGTNNTGLLAELDRI